MFALAFLLIAVGICIYLYARYRHICSKDSSSPHLGEPGVTVYYRSDLQITGDWNFPPKWHPPSAEAWSNKYERTP